MRWRIPIAASAAIILIAASYLWFTLLSPYGYQPPDTVQAIDGNGPHPVFVYGTLRYRPVRWAVIGRSGDPSPVALPGYRRDGLDITPAPEHVVSGLRLSVTNDELARLDRYERLGIRYDRVRVRLDDGTDAWAYRRLNDER